MHPLGQELSGAFFRASLAFVLGQGGEDSYYPFALRRGRTDAQTQLLEEDTLSEKIMYQLDQGDLTPGLTSARAHFRFAASLADGVSTKPPAAKQGKALP